MVPRLSVLPTSPRDWRERSAPCRKDRVALDEPVKRTRSIRTQLAGLVVAIALPLAALEAYSLYSEYRTELTYAERGALYLAEGTAASVAQFMHDAQDVAGNLATWLAEGGLERACGEALSVSNDVISQFRDLVVVRTDGTVACAAQRLPDTVPNLGNQEWFHQAVSSGQPSLGALQVDPILGDWVATMGFPLMDDDGAVIGIVGASLDVGRVLALLEPLALSENAVVTVFDHRYTVVARSSDHDTWVGRRLQLADLAETAAGEGRKLTRAMGLDGIDRTWGTVTLPQTGWMISAGLSREAILAPLRAQILRKSLAALVLVALVIALAGSVYRRIAAALHELVVRTRKAARGEATTLPQTGPAEVIEVGRQFEHALEARTRAEVSERLAKERYRSILENAVFGIYVSTWDGQFIEVNPALAEMLGYDGPDELRTVSLGALYANPEQRASLVHQHEDGRIIDHVEVDWKRKDGSVITVRLNGNTVLDDGRGARAFEVIVEDITEQRSLEEQYRQTQKMEAVGQLAGGVAHDFNNLLTVMIGQTKLLLADLPEGSPAVPAAQEVVEAGERAAVLTRQLLAFSRKEVARPRQVDLNDVVENMEKMLGRLIGEDVGMETRLCPDLYPVLADPGQMEQVLMNLVVNARDAMPRGGRIVVSTENHTLDGEHARTHLGIDPGEYVILRVTDTGVGISPHVQPRVFEPFFTTKPQGFGTGLGLSTVYGIVTQTGGEVTLHSRPGEGSTFAVLLPRHPEPEAVASTGTEVSASRGGGETILVVEDEAPVRSVITRVLTRAGYRVLAAEDGRDALRVASEHEGPIQLTVTDMVMPGMRGIELAERLVELRPESRVLFISGYAYTPDLHRWIHDDPNVLLPKPFTPQSLQERVFLRLHPPTSTPGGAGDSVRRAG